MAPEIVDGQAAFEPRVVDDDRRPGVSSLDSVFLSASIPDPRRNRTYALTADNSAIREAVVALARVVLEDGALVFGGHPAISPLVLTIARQLGQADRVRIFQSEFFRDRVPEDSLAFPVIVWTQKVGDDRAQSLSHMRQEMLKGPFRAGVFIGGMEGVEEEYALFRAMHPLTPAYALASTGAAASALLARDPGDPARSELRKALERDYVYDPLFRSLPGVGRSAPGA